MKDLRIVFMGTPQFAVASLQALIANQKNVVGVITAPDKPAGRGQSLRQSAVKEFAVQYNINVLQPTNLKEASFLEALKNLQANLFIVVAFRMLPKAVWEMPKYGTFNLHASLLPDYRGAAPINWAIINGETKTGITTFFIDDKIDTGDLILQEEVAIAAEDNAETLHNKLMAVGSELVIKTVEQIASGTVKTIPQNNTTNLKTAYKLNNDNTKINWEHSPEAIYNLVRGLSPYPSAWSYLDTDSKTLSVKIFKTTIETTPHNLAVGQIITTKSEMKVAVKNGYIKILEMQLPGKKRMDIKSLLNGYRFSESAKMR